MKTLLTFLALIALFPSCDAIPIAPEPAYYPSKNSSGDSSSCTSCDTSGKRLRRYVYTSSDGLRAERPARFYDTVLEAECAPVHTNAGFLCVPFGGASTVSQNVYVDASCKMPGLYLDATCDPPKFLHVTSPAACGVAGTSVILSVAPTATMHAAWRIDGTNCVPIQVSELAGKAVFAVLGEADYNDFAPVTLGIE